MAYRENSPGEGCLWRPPLAKWPARLHFFCVGNVPHVLKTGVGKCRKKGNNRKSSTRYIAW